MNQLNNVTLIKKANQYFDGNVTSRKVVLEDNTVKTLGIMMPGIYEFSTSARELMEIIQGDLEILLAGDKQWQSVQSGGQFFVAANSSFKVRAHSVIDYCCSYLS